MIGIAGEAHSKLILAGEHAVVYGKPAIAMPFPLKARCLVKEIEGPILFESAFYTGPLVGLPEKMRGFLDCIVETLSCLNKPAWGLSLRVSSEIPLGRGLGSSASIAIAIVRGLFSYCGRKPSREELFYLVDIAETHAHGNPSGIDMAAGASEFPIWFERGREAIKLISAPPMYIVVGDTGRIGDTRRAVENVRKRRLSEPEVVEKSLNKIESIVISAREALLNGDVHLLGRLLNLNQEELVSLGVSDDGINRLVEAALGAGALGAKLTGGGLGGCMIALSDSLDGAKGIAERLIKAGAPRSWCFVSSEDSLQCFNGGRINESYSEG